MKLNRIISRGWSGKHCGLCGLPVLQADMTIDHIRPVCKGGKNKGNTQPAHKNCNQLKGSDPDNLWVYQLYPDLEASND